MYELMLFALKSVLRRKYIIQLKRQQWLKEDELISLQEKRLRKTIKHAYANVEFYHNLFKSVNIEPNDIKTVTDLKKIPIVTKRDIQKNYPNKIISKETNLQRCYISKTTGSTGMPLKIPLDYKELEYFLALIKYIYTESKVRLSDKIVTIMHEPYDVKMRWYHKLGIANRKNILIFNPVESIINSLIEIKPDIIYTYPSMLSLLAKEITEKKIQSIRPRLIFTAGETLSATVRKRLQNVFKSKILRIYGSEEFGRFAFECKEQSGYHLITDSVVLEFIKENTDVNYDETGEVIVTGLHNYNMPLIRYKLGDLATPIKNICPCGRGLPLIKEVEGRKDDYLTLPSGKKISPRTINVIENIPGIVAYRTIQENKNRFVVKLVKGNDFSQNTVNEVKRQIESGCLGEDVEVDVELVSEIPKERTGKMRAIISKVSDQN